MVILGVHGNGWIKDVYAHGASATLIVDGCVIGAISEERLSRQKYDGRFPDQAVKILLEKHNLQAKDIDIVGYTGNTYDMIPLNMDLVRAFIGNQFQNAHIDVIDHHLAHAMASFFTSDFEESCVFTLDGNGDCHLEFTVANNSTFMVGTKNPFNLTKIFNSHNGFGPCKHFTLGSFYNDCSNIILHRLGQTRPVQESVAGKVMGMSAFGNRNKVALKNPFVIHKITSHDFPVIMVDKENQWRMDISKYSVEDIAAWTQWVFEETLLDFFKQVPREFMRPYLCYSGGCALNILANTRLIEEGVFKDIHVSTAPNDDGLSFGVAMYLSMRYEQKVTLPRNHGSLGITYTDEEIVAAYDTVRDIIDITDMDLDHVVSLLEKNQVIAWFQGPSEFGPRALGNRSILANPCFDNKDMLNTKVKHREPWRPYAGIVLQSHLREWFDIPKTSSDYMLFSARVRPEKANIIPAITHADMTCRIQTVDHNTNALLNDLLTRFGARTDVPILLNTSFNTLPGEPIVESPADAFRSFLYSQIDCLVMGKYCFYKKPGAKLSTSTTTEDSKSTNSREFTYQ